MNDERKWAPEYIDATVEVVPWERLVEWYKDKFSIPAEFGERIVLQTARRMVAVFLLLIVFALFKLFTDALPMMNSKRILYFSSILDISVLCVIYSIVVLKTRKIPYKVTRFFQLAAVFGTICIGIYDVFTSSMMVNGFFVVSIIAVLAIFLCELEPILFTCYMMPAIVVMLPLFRVEYGMDLFMNTIILFFMFITLAFVARRNLVKNMKQEMKLIETTRRALSADRAKSSFLARMSHEIRSPINAVLGLDEMIIRESDNDVIIDYAEQIKVSGKSLLSVINDILNLSKIESGKLEIYPAEYNIYEIVRDINHMVAPGYREKGLDFETNISSAIPKTLYGDSTRIKEVILNLLSNAQKYTDEGSVKLKMDFEKADEKAVNIVVSVTDTGRGIRSDDMEKLFAPFERINEEQNASIEGTGLGITICREILHLMGSDLEVSSVPGEGSTFGFSVRQEVRDWQTVDPAEVYNDDLENESEYAVSFTAETARVLAVDDLPVNLLVFGGLLKETRMQIDTASSGAECLVKAKNYHYDMIFIDHMMPKMDGVETLHRLRSSSDPYNRTVPVVVLTANAIAGMKESYMQEGFTDYLSKPIVPEELEKMLLRYLPEEKVELTSRGEAFKHDDDFEKPRPDVAMASGTGKKSSATIIFEKLKKLPDIKAMEAAKNIGGKALYVSAVKEFYETIDYRAGLIEQYLRDGDIDDFVIQVHALKSAARLVGAYNLSDYAKVLEECGKRGDIQLVMLEAAGLLKEYVDLKNMLAIAFESTEQDESEKKEISEQELKEVLETITEAMEVFDSDVAQAAMQKLEMSRLPEDFKPIYEKLKVLMAEVARDDIIELLKE